MLASPTASAPAAASAPRQNKFTPTKLDSKYEQRNVEFGKFKDKLPTVAIESLSYVLWILQHVSGESTKPTQSLATYFLTKYYQRDGKLYALKGDCLAYDPKNPGAPASSTSRPAPSLDADESDAEEELLTDPVLQALETLRTADYEAFKSAAQSIMNPETGLGRREIEQAVILQTIFEMRVAEFPSIPK